MFYYTADVKQRDFGQSSIKISGEQIDAVFGYGLVNVHTVAVVSYQWFRHEGCCFTVSMGDIGDDIFQFQHLIGFFD